MKSRKWVGWVILVAAAVVGAKWLQADSTPKVLPAPIDGFVPTAPPASTPRKFKPLPVESLSKAPVRTNAGEAANELPPVTPPAPTSAPQKLPEVAIELPKDVDAPASRGFTQRRPHAATNSPRFNEESPQTIIQTSAKGESLPGVDSAEVINRRREQVVSLEWVGPATAKIGRPFTYKLIVRNNGDVPANDVIVRDRLPENMKVVSVEPRSTPDSQGYLWNLGSLAPREERHVEIEMVATQRGEVSCHATVTATTAAQAAFRVTQPQLSVSQVAPEKMMVGDPMTMTISVSNPGDGPADGVVVHVKLSDGLRHEKGSEFTIDVGSIGAGDTKPVQLVCSTVGGGNQSVHTVVTGEGDIEAKTESKFSVTEASLDLVFAGPGLRYLDRQAVYTATVTNPGDAPAENVKASITIPSGFKFVAASAGGRHDFTTSSVVWTVGTISPGESKEFSYKAAAIQTGSQKHICTVTGGRGLKKEVEAATRVEGISALLLEVVDIDDPVEVGAETAYEIRVTNQGSREATNVEIHALVPPEMTVRGGQGPTRYRVEGQEVLFAPLPQLAPRSDVIYRVLVTGTDKGDVRFRARLISDSLTEPVIEEESTKVYDD